MSKNSWYVSVLNFVLVWIFRLNAILEIDFGVQKNARAKLTEDGKRARNGFETRIGQAKQSLTTQVNSIKQNLPDFSKLKDDYKEEFEKFSEDLLADKSIKELVDLL